MSFNYDNVIQDNNPLVRKKSKPVSLPLNDEDTHILQDMLTYVQDSQDEELAEANNLRPAVGIAAIQLGIPKKLIAVVVPDENDIPVSYALANPRIISESLQKAYLKNGEGCLSVEKVHQGLVHRHARVSVKGFDMIRNKEITIKAKGYLAIVLQHEIDHFSGTLFYDYINQEDPWYGERDAIIID
ncbi:MAG: peptide deformylase [Longicatena sp.]